MHRKHATKLNCKVNGTELQNGQNGQKSTLVLFWLKNNGILQMRQGKKELSVLWGIKKKAIWCWNEVFTYGLFPAEAEKIADLALGSQGRTRSVLQTRLRGIGDNGQELEVLPWPPAWTLPMSTQLTGRSPPSQTQSWALATGLTLCFPAVRRAPRKCPCSRTPRSSGKTTMEKAAALEMN